MIKLLLAVNRRIHQVFLMIGEISLAAMITVATATVILRYFFNTGISWAEEVPRLLVTLFTFLACAMGVRDKTHMSVSVIYNRFKKGGIGRKLIDIFVDLCILTCGLFMLYYGGMRCIKMMGLAGTLPMTGLKTWWQFLPIPLAGFLITFDSILYLTNVLKPGDTLFSEPEKDAAEIYSKSLQEEAALADGTDIESEVENALQFAPADRDKKDGDAP